MQSCGVCSDLGKFWAHEARVGWGRSWPPRFRLTNDDQATECSCVINPTGLHGPFTNAQLCDSLNRAAPRWRKTLVCVAAAGRVTPA
jgi:hypothetical protein